MISTKFKNLATEDTDTTTNITYKQNENISFIIKAREFNNSIENIFFKDTTNLLNLNQELNSINNVIFQENIISD